MFLKVPELEMWTLFWMKSGSGERSPRLAFALFNAPSVPFVYSGLRLI